MSATTTASQLPPQQDRPIAQVKSDSWTFALSTDLNQPKSGQLMPADEETLMQYAAFLARSIKHSSINTPLFIRNGYELNLKNCPPPPHQLVCRGIKRSQDCSTRTRLPITVNDLKLFFCFLAVPQTSRFDSKMIWAAMTLAFLGFLRLSEITCNSVYSQDTQLSVSIRYFFSGITRYDVLHCINFFFLRYF